VLLDAYAICDPLAEVKRISGAIQRQTSFVKRLVFHLRPARDYLWGGHVMEPLSITRIQARGSGARYTCREAYRRVWLRDEIVERSQLSYGRNRVGPGYTQGSRNDRVRCRTAAVG
jgi:hypothetical protein